jgi:hypothetical protein
MSVNGFQIVTKIGGPQSSSAEIVVSPSIAEFAEALI